MALSPGATIGPYEITAFVGAGGMGEVYRAHDSRLHRDVALKILPPQFDARQAGGGPDDSRSRRFEHEARALAALNHPHVLSVYDVGTHDGTRYLVTEFVEGQTLRSVIESAGARLPVRKAVDITLQMARGLAAAHERGILHRDLKPENVIVMPDGQVKILDFGLARLAEAERAPSTATTGAGTSPGTALGTPGYMAPEQVRGQAVDHRADVFSLGCVAYELLAGRRAFPGDTGADAMSAALKDDPPDLGSANPDVPPMLERIVHRCLEKDPAARFQSAADLAFALQTQSVSTGARASVEAPRQTVTPMRSRERLAWALAAVFLAIASLGLLTRDRSAPPAGDPIAVRADVILQGARSSFVSPDGRYLAYGNTDGVWLRRLDQQEPVRVLAEGGTEGVMCWAPDSTALAVNVKARIRVVSVPSGQSRDLAPTAWIPTSCAWSPGGEIVFSSQLIPMIAIRIADGLVRQLQRTQVADAVGRYDVGGFLPDGRHFVFRAVGENVDATNVGDLADEHAPVRVAETERSGIPDFAFGHLLAGREGVLWARPFDVDRMRFTGDALPLSPIAAGQNRHGFSTARSSSPVMTVHRSSSITTTARVDTLDRQGLRTGTLDESATTFAISPNGTTVAIGKAGGIWLTDLARRAPVRVTGAGTTFHGGVAWARDGRSIYFTRNANSRPALYRRALDSNAQDEQLFEATAATSVNSQRVQPVQGAVIVRAIARVPGASYDLMTLDAGGELRPWLQTDDNEAGPSASADGRWVAYDSDAGGDWNVYVRPTDGSSVPVRVSPAGGRNARWRGDGRELYYLLPSGGLAAVSVAHSAEGVRFGPPTVLFQMPRAPWFGDFAVLYPMFDVTPDGRTFVVRVMRDEPESVVLITNWPALLRQDGK
ncbi:MAG: protein kinase [Vicinamibacterales bacterium]